MEFILDLFNENFAGTFFLTASENSIYVAILQVLSVVFEFLTAVNLPLIILTLYIAMNLWHHISGKKNVGSYIQLNATNPLLVGFILWFTATMFLTARPLNVVELNPVDQTEVRVVEQLKYTPTALVIPITFVNKYVYGVDYTIDVGGYEKGDVYPRNPPDLYLAKLLDGDLDTDFTPTKVDVDTKSAVRKFLTNLHVQSDLLSLPESKNTSIEQRSLVLAAYIEAKYISEFYKDLGAEGNLALDEYVRYFKSNPLNQDLFDSDWLDNLPNDRNAVDEILQKSTADDIRASWGGDTYEYHGAAKAAAQTSGLLQKLKPNSTFSPQYFIPIAPSEGFEEKYCEILLGNNKLTAEIWQAIEEIPDQAFSSTELKDSLLTLAEQNCAAIKPNYQTEANTKIADLDKEREAGIKALVSKVEQFVTNATNNYPNLATFWSSDKGYGFLSNSQYSQLKAKLVENSRLLGAPVYDLGNNKFGGVLFEELAGNTPARTITEFDPTSSDTKNLLQFVGYSSVDGATLKADITEVRDFKSNLWDKFNNNSYYKESIEYLDPKVPSYSDFAVIKSPETLPTPQGETEKLLVPNTDNVLSSSFAERMVDAGIMQMIYNNAFASLISRDTQALLDVVNASIDNGSAYLPVAVDAVNQLIGTDRNAQVEAALSFVEYQLSNIPTKRVNTDPKGLEKLQVQKEILKKAAIYFSFLEEYKKDTTNAVYYALTKSMKENLNVSYALALGFGNEASKKNPIFNDDSPRNKIFWFSLLKPSTAKMMAYYAGVSSDNTETVKIDLHYLSDDEKRLVLKFFKKPESIFSDENKPKSIIEQELKALSPAELNEHLDIIKSLALKKSNNFERIKEEFNTNADTNAFHVAAATIFNTIESSEIIKAIKSYSNDAQLHLINFIATGSFPTDIDSATQRPGMTLVTTEIAETNIPAMTIGHISTIQSPQPTDLSTMVVDEIIAAKIETIGNLFTDDNISLDDEYVKHFYTDTYRKTFISQQQMPMFDVIKPAKSANAQQITNWDDSAYIEGMDDEMNKVIESTDPVTKYQSVMMSYENGLRWSDGLSTYPAYSLPYFKAYLNTAAHQKNMAAISDDMLTEAAWTAGGLVVGAVTFGTGTAAVAAGRAAITGVKVASKAVKASRAATAVKGVAEAAKVGAGKIMQTTAGRVVGASTKVVTKPVGYITKRSFGGLKKLAGAGAGLGVFAAKMKLFQATLEIVKFAGYVFLILTFGVAIASLIIMLRFLKYFLMQKILPFAFYLLTSASILIKTFFEIVSNKKSKGLTTPIIFEETIEKGLWHSIKRVFFLSFEIIVVSLVFTYIFGAIHDSIVSTGVLWGLENGYLYLYETLLSAAIAITVIILSAFYKIYDLIISPDFNLKSQSVMLKQQIVS